MALTPNTIANLSDDIAGVLSSLAPMITLCRYDDGTNTVTFKLKAKGIAMYPSQIAVSKLSERDEAIHVPEELKDLTNITYEDRGNIQPCHRKGGKLKYLDVFKLLLRTNCKECGQPTCPAFATRLAQKEVSISRCSPPFSSQFQERKEKLLEMLRAAGYEVPV